MRRWNATVALTALIATSAVCLTSSATAVAGVHAPARAKTAPATSLGIVPLVDDSVALTQGLTGRAKSAGSVAVSYATGTAISPAGDVALISDSGTHSVIALSHPRTRPTSSTSLGLGRFKGEGGAKYLWYPSAVSFVGGSRHAVVAGGGQGLVQLVRTSRGWMIDDRVHSPGRNAAGAAHQAGLIAIPDSPSGATTYDGLAISPTPGTGGRYLGVTIDRADGTLAVVSGLGTAHPRVESTLSSPDIADAAGDDFGNGGVGFSPAGPRRAAVLTSTGVGVLDLTDPAHPALQSLTTVAGQPQSVAVAPDGNHVLVGAGDHVLLYTGLLTDGPASPLTLVKSVKTGDLSDQSPEVSAIAYLASGSAVVAHGDAVHGYARQTLLKRAQSASAVWGRTHTLPIGPSVDNALSVWPAASPAIVAPHLRKVMRVHQRVVSHLRVKPGGAPYTFRVSSGTLPPHLHLHGARITGTLARTGHFSFTLRAKNVHGAVLTRHLSIHVERRR